MTPEEIKALVGELEETARRQSNQESSRGGHMIRLLLIVVWLSDIPRFV